MVTPKKGGGSNPFYCVVCRQKIPPTSRIDKITCGDFCRKRRHNWVQGVWLGRDKPLSVIKRENKQGV